jgi:hypothetical protein
MCKLYSSDIPKIIFINFYPVAAGDPAYPVIIFLKLTYCPFPFYSFPPPVILFADIELNRV